MPWSEIEPASLVRFLRETSTIIWTVNGDGYALDLPGWTQLTGQTAQEAGGTGWMHAIHAEDVDRVDAAWRTAVVHGTPYNTVYRLRCADGMYRWFNARANPVFDDRGIVIQWIGAHLAISITNRTNLRGPTQAMTADKFQGITPRALRAARAMLGWTAERLAEESGISRTTIRRFESDTPTTQPHRSSAMKILHVLMAQGIGCSGRDGLITTIEDISVQDITTHAP